MLTVKFNSTEEFLEELRKDPPPDNILRQTSVYRSSKISPNIKLVSVLGTYLNKRSQVVALDHYCGDIWVGEKETYQIKQQKIKDVCDKINQCAQELGLEVRSGTLET
jgi:methionine salvage enolase-phosphatase E1